MEPLAERTVTTGSPAETYALGTRLGALIEPGDFIGLTGSLGAGKTQLVRGVAEGCGVPAREVSSPTFAILYPYQGRLRIHHVDLYRLASVEALEAIGFFELRDDPGAAMLVEWVEKIPKVAPDEWLHIAIEANDEVRQLRATAYGRRFVTLVDAWL